MSVYIPHLNSRIDQVAAQPLALVSNISKISEDRFEEIVIDIEELSKLEGAECKFLFQFPALLIGQDSDNAAAILCRDDDGLRIAFLVLNETDNEVELFHEEEAPEHLVNFTWSFANILSILPTGSQITEQ